MNLTVRDRKLLWAKAGNRCSYRFRGDICGQLLVLAAGGKDVVVGEECHIIGDKPGSARYSPDCPNRESYDNAVLLCSAHHKMVDDNPAAYTVATLQAMKCEHEATVSAGTGEATERLEFADSEFITEVCGADRAVGMEVTKPASFTDVKSTLKAVNVKEATWTNTIGAPELISVWTDPDFEPEVSAAYYARVLEIPTPRWTAYEAERFGITMKEEIPMINVERAYTSPIWYTP